MFWDAQVEKLLKRGGRRVDEAEVAWRPVHVVHLLNLQGAFGWGLGRWLDARAGSDGLGQVLGIGVAWGNHSWLSLRAVPFGRCKTAAAHPIEKPNQPNTSTPHTQTTPSSSAPTGADFAGSRLCFDFRDLSSGAFVASSTDGQILGGSFVKPAGGDNPDYARWGGGGGGLALVGRWVGVGWALAGRGGGEGGERVM